MRDPFNNRILSWVHRRPCAMGFMVPCIGATMRYCIAQLRPFHDGNAPGRAYTKLERRLSRGMNHEN